MTFDHSELEQRGWTAVSGISTTADLLGFAQSLGRPVRAPTGELVKRLIPKTSGTIPGTLSSTFGMGAFPLHTDTAFWPLPCRYIVFRVTGDVRRHTTLMSFSELLESCPPDKHSLFISSVWLAGAPSKSFYCSMTFRKGEHRVWRYDAQCMRPANLAAKLVREKIHETLLRADIVHHIDWSKTSVAVLSNWTVLHGRAPRPADEGFRLLERIYVE